MCRILIKYRLNYGICIKNIVGKGENAGYQHFLLFPRFQKLFSSRVVKTQDCVGKGKAPFYLLSIKAYSLDQSKVLSWGKGFNHIIPLWIDWMVFYAAFSSNLVISQQQFKVFVGFLGFTGTRQGL